MKGMLFAILLIGLLASVSALRINEVEMNPTGDDIGYEWVELYNEGSNDVNISGWQIWDGLKTSTKRYTILNETTIKLGEYYIITLKSQVLNNDKNGDFVILKNFNNETIYQIPTIIDESDDSQTWQLCGTEWEFLQATKGTENSCPTQTLSETQNNSEQAQITNNETTTIPTTTTTTQTPSLLILGDKLVNETHELEPINLNAKNIKTQNGNEGNKKYAIYGFIGFCILLTILFILKKKDRKNEFR